jgi:cobalt-zinc-cadmium efflux system protein
VRLGVALELDRGEESVDIPMGYDSPDFAHRAILPAAADGRTRRAASAYAMSNTPSGPDAHAGHSHALPADADARKLTFALALIVAFMVGEVVVGALVHSLALLSDAAHMLTDAGAIGLSLFAIRLAARPAKGAMTFGFKRAEILSAQFNGATLLVLALLIIYEAITRLVHPPHVLGTPVLVVALAGIVVNLAATALLSKASRQSMNVEGVFQHLLTDLAAFIFTAIAGLVIITTGFRRADAIASLVVAAIMLKAASGLLRESGRVFLEAAPRGLDPNEVHDLHIWEVSSGFPSLSAHILVGRDTDCHAVRQQLERLLRERFELEHTTLQVEHQRDELISIQASVAPATSTTDATNP